MKTHKRLACLVLSFAFVLSTVAFASDEENSSEVTQAQKADIITMLNSMEGNKAALDLSGVNFSNLNVGNPIHAYQYIDSQFVESHLLYPLTEGSALVVWAISIGNQYQITTSLVGEIGGLVTENEPFALVYDRNHGYLYAGGEFTILTEFEENLDRSILPTEELFPDLEGLASAIEVTALAEKVSLGYVPAVTPYSVNSTVMLNVDAVSQNPPSYICWAATIACIVNYCTGTDYTAADIAIDYYGSQNYNQRLDYRLTPPVFSDYGLFYTDGNVPSDNTILDNLNEDYPIYGRFISSTGTSSHACVIYGINTSAGYIYIMDPYHNANNGTAFTTCVYSSSDGYTFVSGWNGKIWNLNNGVCHLW